MLGEFDQIQGFMAPLATSQGAMGLQNDGAVFTLPQGEECVITTDTLIADVHFFADDVPSDIAAKLMAVNLSDLAAMGATPRYYSLNTSYNADTFSSQWLQAFAAELHRQQDHFGLSLLGGDTTRTPGPLTLSLTAFGSIPMGKAFPRLGARVGDLLCMTGTLGDSALGLRVCKGDLPHDEYLISRYRRPSPRIDVGLALREYARTCLDISDGLFADLHHMQCGVDVFLDQLPLSNAAKTLYDADPSLLSTIINGGDDYELLFTISPQNRALLKTIEGQTETPMTVIGLITEHEGPRLLDADGQEIALDQTGYRHF